MKLSIVIPTYNRPQELSRCLTALAKEVGNDGQCEVIVVDDCSEASVKALLLSECSSHGYAYHYQKQNSGAAACRNAGIEIAQGDWVCFIDDDVEVQSGWYSVITRQCESVAQTVLGIEGAVTCDIDNLWDGEVSNSRGGLYLTCNIAYRLSALKLVNGFDVRFRDSMADDQELACRIIDKGEIVFAADCVVRHQKRNVNLPLFVWRSPLRIKKLLAAECLFAALHPSRYKTLRRASTFWGTYRTILLRHCISSLRRRSSVQLRRHAVATLFLLCGELLAQCAAWFYLPAMSRLQYQIHTQLANRT